MARTNLPANFGVACICLLIAAGIINGQFTGGASGSGSGISSAAVPLVFNSTTKALSCPTCLTPTSAQKHVVYTFLAGDSQNGVPAAGFNWTAANNSLVNPANRIGSNTVFAVLPFPKAASPEIQASFYLTPEFVAATTIRAEILWSSIGTGNVKWLVKTAAVPAGSSLDPTLATSTSTVTAIASANALALTTLNISDPSASQSRILFFSLTRMTADGTDTLAASADLVSVVFSISTAL